MAGYIFVFSTPESLFECVQRGSYSTRFNTQPNGNWLAYQEGTFADFASMVAGDNLYFFSKRRVYGIGKLVNVGPDCKYLNFPNAGEPNAFTYGEVEEDLLEDFGDESPHYRFICYFEPDPFIFRNGIDMDDVLSSDPRRFKMLRVLSNLTFIKFDSEENQAFRDVLLKRNTDALDMATEINTFTSNHQATHGAALDKINSGNYQLNCAPILISAAQQDSRLSREMAIEAGIIAQISEDEASATGAFGNWDYLSHQVNASPLKPVIYIDKMDLFGYRYLMGHRPTIDKFLVGEIKKDQVTKRDLLQLMKYVDWVKNEYASGDYSMIRAFLVGFNFHADVLTELSDLAERNYVRGFRETVSNEKWLDVTLVRYEFDADASRLRFHIVPADPL